MKPRPSLKSIPASEDMDKTLEILLRFEGNHTIFDIAEQVGLD